MDYLSFFVETITEDFMEHLKCYKAASLKVQTGEAEGQLMSSAKRTLIEEAYFEGQDSKNPWKAVCCNQQAKLS